MMHLYFPNLGSESIMDVEELYSFFFYIEASSAAGSKENQKTQPIYETFYIQEIQKVTRLKISSISLSKQ